MKIRITAIAVLGALLSLSTASIVPAHGAFYRRDDSNKASNNAHSVSAQSSSHGSAGAATTHAVAPAVCGNGLVERGEECDCGSPEECAKDPCCNAKTCKLTAGSQCSNKQDCCNKCQFRPATFTCRAATADCDSIEMCTGKSSKCPSNKNECPKPKHSNGNATSIAAASGSSSSTNATMCGSQPCSDRDLQCRAQSTGANKFTASCAGDESGAQYTPSCQIRCLGSSTSVPPSSSPGETASGCFTLSAIYTDGTSCGQEGVCSNGVCTGDKNTVSFFKKNTTIFAIGGSCAVALLGLCCMTICCVRRRRRQQRRRTETEKEKREQDSYQMSENVNNRPKSNIRIGLDPYENGLVNVLSAYEPNSGVGLGRRPSDSKQQTISATAAARAGHKVGAYPSESLMTDQEMAEALESDTHKRLNPSQMSNWPTFTPSRTGSYTTQKQQQQQSQAYTLPPISATGRSLLDSPPSVLGSQKKQQQQQQRQGLRKSPSSSNQVLYTPPPLPPLTLVTSPTHPSGSLVSPYADDAMIVFPPESPPPGPMSGFNNNSINSNTKQSQQPTTTTTSELSGPPLQQGFLMSQQSKMTNYESDDEPSFLQLDTSMSAHNSLAVDKYSTSSKQDRASVCSFFSTLAIDPEPAPPVPELPPPKILPSDKFIIPTPVARRAPRPASPMHGGSKDSSSSSPVNNVSARRVDGKESEGGKGEGTEKNRRQNSAARSPRTPLHVAGYDDDDHPPPPNHLPPPPPTRTVSGKRREEESQIAASFAHDLGFEIVERSPATSPRMMVKKAVPTASRII